MCTPTDGCVFNKSVPATLLHAIIRSNRLLSDINGVALIVKSILNIVTYDEMPPLIYFAFCFLSS